MSNFHMLSELDSYAKVIVYNITIVGSGRDGGQEKLEMDDQLWRPKRFTKLGADAVFSCGTSACLRHVSQEF